MGLDCYLGDSSDPYMQLVYECDSGGTRYLIKRMAHHFTAQLQGDVGRDDASQSLHGSSLIPDPLATATPAKEPG